MILYRGVIIINRDLAKRNKYIHKANYVDSPFESMRKRRNICTYEEIEAFAMEPLSKYIMYDKDFRSLRVLSRILLIALIADAKGKADSAYGSRVYYFKKSEIDYESFIGVKRSTFRNLFDELLAMEYVIRVDIDVFCISLL